MTTSPDILAKQAAYAARPFAAYVSSSHFSGGFRFDTEAEAIDYLFTSYARTKSYIANPARHGFGSEWIGWDSYRSELETPAGVIQARFVLMADCLSSTARARAVQS